MNQEDKDKLIWRYYLIFTTLITLVTIVITYVEDVYNKEFFRNILAELHGIFIELIIFAILLKVVIKRRVDIQKEIQNYQEEIYELRDNKTDDVILKIVDNIKKLNKRKVYKINLKEYHLSLKKGRVDLKNVNLQESKLNEVNLENADLSEATLMDTDMREAKLINAILYSANLKNAELIGANLMKADLEGVELQNANLSGANLKATSLKNANLKGAKLISADLEGSKLEGAIFEETDLKYANFEKTDISRVSFYGVKNIDYVKGLPPETIRQIKDLRYWK
jgi:hypothetical protein